MKYIFLLCSVSCAGNLFEGGEARDAMPEKSLVEAGDALVETGADVFVEAGTDVGAGDTERLLVPAQSFVLGRGIGDPDDLACTTSGGPYVCNPDEVPGVTVTVRAFWLNRFEVTVSRFRGFVMSGFWPSPGMNGGTEPGWEAAWPNAPTDWDAAALGCLSSQWTPASGANEARPMNCLTWYEAYAFCIWDGGFLPTEAEWESAASGGEERVFPWSTPPSNTTIDQSRACYAGCGGVVVADHDEDGAGRWGHLGLAGNVWEWALDYYAPYPKQSNLVGSGQRVMRGGDYGQPAPGVRSASRFPIDPTGRYVSVGFRCAYP